MSARDSRRLRSRVSLWLAILSAAFIVYGTTIPFRFIPDRRLIANRWHRLTFNPLFPTASGKRTSIPDAAQNILLFVPFGIFAAGALDRLSSPRRRFLAVVAAGGVLSTTVESLQLIAIGRTASFGDVVFNSCGAGIGAVASTAAMGALTRLTWGLKRRGALDAPTCYPLLVAAALVCLGAWEPFNVTLDPGNTTRKLVALGRDMWRADGPSNEALQMLRFTVLSLLAASWLRDLGVRRAAATAVAACGVLAVGLELTQLMIESRIPGLTDLSMDVLGAVVGGLFFQRLGGAPTSRLWFTVLASATWLAAIMPALSPYKPSPIHEQFWLLSFGYPRYLWVRATRQAFELFLMCFPLGFALPWVARRTAWVYCGALGIAVLCEGSVAGLTRWAGTGNPTILDVIIAALGALVGAVMGREGRRWFRNSIDALGRTEVLRRLLPGPRASVATQP